MPVRMYYLWGLWGLLLALWVAWLFPWGLLILLWGALSIHDDGDITVSIFTFITVPTFLLVTAVSLAKARAPGASALMLIFASILIIALPAAMHAGG